ncbi:SpaH/EbpB family LPXTG-anchored major pilin [Bifidobacterium callitrichidarum]|uniref:Cell surface protein n=1 Tax=Bifidobacterium callitrichidarum TaxID=2052941 RepID=A0A2U2NAM3_9BIFI|nr:SpaH/EbpB family LPXTG-anchored major pilin [Bifidobacterium callitrichidarum]PWG66084.1 cell surface protein [Bifidobacterium callitrichidarum]
MNSLTKKLAAGVLAAATLFGFAGLGATTANAADAADGKLTVNSTDSDFAGKSVSIYKMLDYDSTTVADSTTGGYTVNASWTDFFKNSTELGLSDVTEYNVNQKAYDLIAGLSGTSTPTITKFAELARAWAKDNATATDTKTVGNDIDASGNYSATFENLAYGYYLVSNTLNEKGMLVNVTNNTPINQTLKGSTPTVDKTVTDKDGNQSNHNSAQIGDKVDFTLTSIVPDMSGASDNYLFQFTDKLSKGLTLNTDAEGDQQVFNPTVMIGNTVLTKGTDYTATYAPGTGANEGKTVITITMKDFKNLHANDAGETITVKYSATLNENAVVAGDNDNEAQIDYGNDPSNPQSSKPDKTHTYDFGFDVNKVAEKENGEKLENAQFELQDAEGKKINLVKMTAADQSVSFRPAKTGETAAQDAEVKTDANGKLRFEGLKEGTYYLKETKAPTGYNNLKDSIEIVIAADYNNDGTLKSWTVNKASVATGATVPVVTIINKKGGLLPGTGSIGTAAFTAFGVLIMALGTVWYVKSNRKSGKRA